MNTLESTYLVTGCAGFIGSAVCARLLAQGHRVVGFDNLNDAYDTRLKRWRLDQLEPHPHFTFHRVDISNNAALESIWPQVPDPEAILNLAARAGVRQSVEEPQAYINTNITGTLNLLQQARYRGIKKFVLASTSSLYGVHNPLPYREDADTDHPLSPYAASKKGAEALCHTYHRLFGIDITIFRYFTVYGPAGRPDMSIFRFIQWIQEGRPVTVYGDGTQTRDFTYVDDIARGTVRGLGLTGFQVINLGSDHPVALIEIIHTIEAQLGQQANLVFEPAHPADVPATWADITRARTLLDWQPEIAYRQGLESSIAWYHVNREWAKNIHTG